MKNEIKSSPFLRKSPRRKSRRKPMRKSPKKSRRKPRRKSPKKSRRKSPKKPKRKSRRKSAATSNYYNIKPELPEIGKQCFEYNGKYIYINQAIENKLPIIMIGLENKSELLKDGVYTWLYGNVDNTYNKIFLMKCITTNEATNKHIHILRSIIENFGTFNLIGAGELKRSSELYDIYEINGLSGSFMVDVDELTQQIILENVRKLLQNEVNIVIIDDTMETFINNENVPLTRDTLEHLLNLGFSFNVYTTKEDCINAKNYEINLTKAQSTFDMENRCYERKPNIFPKPVMPYIPFPKGITINCRNFSDYFKLD